MEHSKASAIVNQLRVEVPYQKRVNNRILCEICPQFCKLDEGGVGICGGRQVIDGRLIATNYGQVSSLQLDPIEKKPLYHFYPGSEILSVGPNGCNLTCKWCQNWQISQNSSPTRTILPNELADMIDALDGIGVAYTYAEPLIWFEYVRDVGKILHERGLMNVFITNGYTNEEPLLELLPLADAFNVDLKTSDDSCYKNFCGGKLEDVQRTIKLIHSSGKHLEITHLVVPGTGDILSNVEKLVKWIASLDRGIPLHLSRYFPSHRYLEPPTDLVVMQNAYKIAREHLDWVYLGNVWNDADLSSYCPNCQSALVTRSGYRVQIVNLKGDTCGACGHKVYFRGDGG